MLSIAVDTVIRTTIWSRMLQRVPEKYSSRVYITIIYSSTSKWKIAVPLKHCELNYTTILPQNMVVLWEVVVEFIMMRSRIEMYKKSTTDLRLYLVRKNTRKCRKNNSKTRAHGTRQKEKCL